MHYSLIYVYVMAFSVSKRIYLYICIITTKYKPYILFYKFSRTWKSLLFAVVLSIMAGRCYVYEPLPRLQGRLTGAHVFPAQIHSSCLSTRSSKFSISLVLIFFLFFIHYF